MSAATKQERQRAIRELVARGSAGSQVELAAALRSRGFAVTQATVSRDIGELGLVKVARGDRHVYLAPEDLAPPATQAVGSDERLRRILRDIPVRIGRSGLTLLLIGSPGSASVLGQAVDESSLHEQEGTLAGDNTLLVLFAAMGVRLGVATIVVAHVAFSISFVTVVVRARLAGMDNHLEEAAMTLGADHWRSFRRVTLPLIMPGVVAGALLAFTLSFDDYIITSFVSGSGSSTLPVVIYGMVRRNIDPTVNAVSTVVLLVTTLLIYLSDRYARA